MKRFLFVSIVSGDICSPSRIIDEIWHEFILHTTHYRNFCDKNNGSFIDHTPSDIPEIEGYIRTKALAESIFGQLDEFCWPEPKDASQIGKCTCTNKGCTCNCSNNIGRLHG
ncbi:hypothetical protein HY249_01775 [Candidatus Azambacteria bacterium]|nr:hypothetical protein [Candidatus Azambacteria bacterium]